MAVKNTRESALDVHAQARAAGLGKAVEQFPGDVVVAAHAAASARDTLPGQANVAAEPWPPMRVRNSK